MSAGMATGLPTALYIITAATHPLAINASVFSVLMHILEPELLVPIFSTVVPTNRRSPNREGFLCSQMASTYYAARPCLASLFHENPAAASGPMSAPSQYMKQLPGYTCPSVSVSATRAVTACVSD